MLTSIFILILFLPAAFLPLGLSTFFSSNDLDEMGICLERPENWISIQSIISMPSHEPGDTFQKSIGCEDAIRYVWETSEGLQVCQ